MYTGSSNQQSSPIDSTILNKMCEILQTALISPYMDYLLHAACVTLVLWGIYNLTLRGDVTFMVTSEGIKNRPI